MVKTKLSFYGLSMLLALSSCHLAGQNDSAPEHSAQVPNLDVYDNCPLEGEGKSERIKELNKLKNRYAIPSQKDIDTSVTLEKLIAPGNDRTRWNTSHAARIRGYISDVKVGGVETCNCKEKDKSIRDTHLEMVTDPMSNGKMQRMIIEVTPRLRELMKEQGVDWNTTTLRDKLLGRWVQVEGWLLFDEEHEMASENTNPGNESNWRATAWEIHPITKLEIINRPR